MKQISTFVDFLKPSVTPSTQETIRTTCLCCWFLRLQAFAVGEQWCLQQDPGAELWRRCLMSGYHQRVRPARSEVRPTIRPKPAWKYGLYLMRTRYRGKITNTHLSFRKLLRRDGDAAVASTVSWETGIVGVCDIKRCGKTRRDQTLNMFFLLVLTRPCAPLQKFPRRLQFLA